MTKMASVSDLLKHIVGYCQNDDEGMINGTDASPRQSVLELLNRNNSSGNTSLHWAAMNGHLECVKVLVGAGGDATIKNGAGREAAVEAERAGKEDVASFLLSVTPADGIVEEGETNETVDAGAAGESLA